MGRHVFAVRTGPGEAADPPGSRHSDDGEGRYAEAEPLHKRLVAIKKEVIGPEHPDAATTLENDAVPVASSLVQPLPSRPPGPTLAPGG